MPMAPKKMASRKPAKIQKAIRNLTFTLDSVDQYVDIAESLSMVNRKLFRSPMAYGIESVEFKFDANPNAFDSITVTALTAGDSWSVHNAHVKGHALWNQMNQLVLEDNPSIEGKWADFKVYLDGAHVTASNLVPRDSAGVAYIAGEWNYAKYVMPEHSVDAAGNPLPADETFGHLIGDDIGVPGALVSVGLVKAYQESRATVFDNNPNVPGGMSTSFFNLLTDSGSQEPELADQIEARNDDPPYSLTHYPGGDTNAPVPIVSEYGVASVGFPLGTLEGFVAQCGLIKFNVQAFKDGVSITPPNVSIRLNVMAGKYKGVAAIPMGQ